MPPSTARAGAWPDDAQVRLSRPAPGIIAVLFLGYLSVGLPLPLLPLFVHDQLGFGSPVVGAVIGIQFLSTVLTRGYAGRVTDHAGGRRSALQGAMVCTLVGLLYFIAVLPGMSPATSLAILVIGRLAAGFGESQLVTGCVSWSIASVGPQRAALSMSWTGIAMFAALALGAPLGMAFRQLYGLGMAMVACGLAPLLAANIALSARPYAIPTGPRLAFHRVVGQIWREGLGLMLQGIGLSCLTAFASLYFAAHAWRHSGLVMTAFGIGFIAVRLALGHLPDKMGGYRVALWSLVVEALGQLIVWAAPDAATALFGALITGMGCSLVYPALGVEALGRILPANRGSAMGAFSAFLDIAFGIAGPTAGVIASHFGYASVFLLGTTGALFGAVLVASLRGTSRARLHERSDTDPASRRAG